MVKDTKKRLIVKRLRELRDTEPAVPLRSMLDLVGPDENAIEPKHVEDLLNEGEYLSIVTVSGTNLCSLSFLYYSVFTCIFSTS